MPPAADAEVGRQRRALAEDRVRLDARAVPGRHRGDVVRRGPRLRRSRCARPRGTCRRALSSSPRRTVRSSSTGQPLDGVVETVAEVHAGRAGRCLRDGRAGGRDGRRATSTRVRTVRRSTSPGHAGAAAPPPPRSPLVVDAHPPTRATPAAAPASARSRGRRRIEAPPGSGSSSERNRVRRLGAVSDACGANHEHRALPGARSSAPVASTRRVRTDDRAQHPVRRLRAARRRGGRGRQRRLAARRRDGRALRPEPDAGAAGREEPARRDRPAAGLPSDDRRPGPLGAGLRRGGRGQRDLPRRGGRRRRRHGTRDPRRGRARRPVGEAGHPARAVPRGAARVRHAAGDDRRTRIRRAEVHGRGAAQGAARPRARAVGPPAAVRRGGRRHRRGHHRRGRRGRRGRVRRGLVGLRRGRPREGRGRVARYGSCGDGRVRSSEG